jgi:hypothetical protein
MKNVTITLDERTAAWARVYAARHNMSVSRLVGEMLQGRMREHKDYDEAMRRFLAKPQAAGPTLRFTGRGDPASTRGRALADRAGQSLGCQGSRAEELGPDFM